ncbi:TPA: AIPR family protein [Aeromonas hydrophila]|uniref:AIPR family protein n=1 Tax=Aeromonas hydrophila TaxID=644 RepID=UPI0028D9DD49|nr:AIPR family protein [Aeromonas hydrophila]
MAYKTFSDSPFMSALSKRDDLAPFKENDLAAFGIELCFGIDDPIGTLLPAVTGSGGDAKIDILYVSREQGIIVVCQVYKSLEIKKSAKGNKGTDLTPAMSVVLSTDEAALPPGVAPHIKDARAAIRDGDIRAIHVWYAHNCPESIQIQQDMALHIPTIRTLLNQYGDNGKAISLSLREVGLETLDKFYRASTNAIAVEDKFSFDTPRVGFEKKDGAWQAFITTVSGHWLANLYRDYESKGLYNPNVRGFMGANNKDTDKKINAGIQSSAKSNSNEFFVFNNGITALVHDFELSDDKLSIKSITGIGIVNGAQTTGSLGELDASIDLHGIEVGVRFIKCEDKETIQSITRYNNSQNKVIQSDFRANDSIQKRLRSEFNTLKTAEYDGGLRGHNIIDKKSKIDAHAAAQALTAWHGSPYDSYHNKMNIWDEDSHYKRAFDESISAEHVLFVHSLFEAANILKAELQEEQKKGSMKKDDETLLEYLNERGSAFLIIHSISGVLETMMDKKILSPYRISFHSNIKKDAAVSLWKEFLKLFAKFITLLQPGLVSRLSNKSAIASAKEGFIRDFGTFIKMMQDFQKKNPCDFIISKMKNEL